jgi:predicted AlkP superfamily pyrophosphatase or phosphodiesterase
MRQMRLNRLFPALLAVAALLLSPLTTLTASAQVYEAKPKLVVIVVIDQFRADMLSRYRSEFKGRGFRLFLDDGAWFPDCYYNYVNTKTAPGHATIGTGAYSDGHGIDSNEWWDASRSFDRRVTSVQDERYSLVDLPEGTPANPGASPRNLRATTIGDEVRLATGGKSRVFGVSLKDRAAIMPAGQSANAAYWMDNLSGRFTTSTYYEEHLPAWAAAFNASGRAGEARKEAGGDSEKPFNEQVESTPAANRYELDFVNALLAGEKLGQGDTTDVLTVSLSAHDIAGHMYGPDSEQEHAMVLGLDRDLDSFFSSLDKTIGLKNVWIALSADHGVAPVPAKAAQLGINAATVDLARLIDNVNAILNARFSNPENKLEYVMGASDLPYLVLNRLIFEAMKIDEKTAEEALREALPEALAKMAEQAPHDPATHRLPPTPRIYGIYTRLDFENNRLPQSEMGRMLAHSFTSHGNWFAMLMLDGYQMNDLHSSGTTHFSPWSYDRHVPLAFYGSAFVPGTYRGRVEPVDLAATLASLLGVNQPSASVGHVLTEAIRKP